MASGQLIFQFRSQFPEFDTVPDADISVSLDISKLWLDPTVWSVTDFPMALLFWAAHFLSLKQMQLASVEFGGTGATDLFIQKVSFGERNVSFGQRNYGQQAAEKMLGPGEQMLLYTIYGMQFIQLRSRNVIPVVVV